MKYVYDEDGNSVPVERNKSRRTRLINSLTEEQAHKKEHRGTFKSKPKGFKHRKQRIDKY